MEWVGIIEEKIKKDASMPMKGRKCEVLQVEH
jgi:hypothetical protein